MRSAPAGWFRKTLRDWREREVRIVLSALVVAVATVATIALFASQLQHTLVTSASAFMAGDRQLEAENGQPVPQAWRDEANQRGIATARVVEFSTMVYGGGRFQLVSVNAASDEYPLRGQIEMQATPEAPRRQVSAGPPPGEVWINPRLLRLLEIQIGDAIEVGNRALTVTGLLLRQPDGGFAMSALAPRILMHDTDVPSTGVIQDGSRVEYENFFAGEEAALDAFYEWLRPRLSPSHEWASIRDGQTLSDSLRKAERFLLLGGSLAVLLSSVAVAVASRQYALRQRDTVALLKTLGQAGPHIARGYLARLTAWAVCGLIGGILLAIPLSWGLSLLISRLLDQPMAYRMDWLALGPALATALVALFAFAYPPIRRLRHVPAMRVLRSQPGETGQGALRDGLVALIAVFGLVWLYARELELVLALLGGLAALLGVLAVMGWCLMMALRRVSGGGNAWRLALVGLYRHRRASLAQMSVFAMTLMLAAILVLVRSSLLDDWQSQLPEDTPNHFLINIAPDAVEDVRDFLTERDVSLGRLYPMVRGRLTEINGQPVRQAVSKDEEVNALNRELNLTWMEALSDNNAIVAGDWFDAGQRRGVSIEAELAERLGVDVGDRLGFTIGSETIAEPVKSIRTVQWDSMRPNFYMVFPPEGALTDLPATWITSFYLDPSRKSVLNDFTASFPTVSVLELDHIIDRIRDIVGQVTQAIEAILALVLAAALVVMAAVVSATLQDRQREGALLRTLGAHQRLLTRSTMMEFALLGGLAGLLGVMAAEVAVWALQYRMFEGAFRWHWPVLIAFPVLSAVVLSLFGRWQLRPVLQVSPMLLLRRLE
ncbi:putative ABC transport system permease protein [Tamilnaduibacter salinus]|uniref:Putative ABC transport system permease protein n=1 Tax=Tamilnaduibacter salinus TaxID=1484056 RepID=A0A2U1D020_9GAMM|nr:FtsX-like permease family protein [Tamilnaduibacter salinus]PVY78388.1 putative ABC transport system permease protein [Tamilnaduibacter salinus]